MKVMDCCTGQRALEWEKPNENDGLLYRSKGIRMGETQ